MADKLFKQLETLGKILCDDYPYINDGGCAVFSCLVSKALSRRRIKHRICVLQDLDLFDGIKPKFNKVLKKNKPKSLSEWNHHGIYFCHVITEFTYRGIIYRYDMNGIRNKDEIFEEDKEIIGYIPYKDMYNLASKSKGWNDCFDRNDIPDIAKLVRKYLR